MTTETATPIQNIWHKAIAGIFAAVVAPVMVAFGVKFSDKVMTPAAAPTPAATASAATTPANPATPATGTAPAATAGADAAATAPATTAAPALAAPTAPAALPQLASSAPPTGSASRSGLAIASSSPSAGGEKTAPQLPTFKKPLSQAQRLFNGRDLTGFYTYLGKPNRKAKPYGKGNDPDRVFSVEGGLLRVSGETPGVLETEKEYSDYWLTVEYKWGEKTWPPDEQEARRSGILLNIDGPDGAIHSAVPCAFFVHLIEGGTGDLFVASNQGEQHYGLTAAVELRPSLKQKIAFYTPGAPRTTFNQGLIKRYPPGPVGHDTKGFHPPGDLERPTGEWNKLDCAVLNGKIWIRLNDHVVNFATDVTPAGGRIGIQSHGAEIYFREITLQPYLKHREHGEQVAN
ncbi:MAG TPA: DUF1080 domain-containing protein [Pirellulales bacterium]|jgi:hypothetical protein|nr:DUF1080 domain-containing protein [Pirellulales bacterium]